MTERSTASLDRCARQRCRSDSVTVCDSRVVGGERRRRRVCNTCGHRWTTVEVRVQRLVRLARVEVLVARLAEMMRDPQDEQ
jgi:transcriptional regulator NrdR family protein